MREVLFLNRNQEKWKKFENNIVNFQNADPDTLADLYIQTMEDLSYSRTYYPNSKTTIYLNQLSTKIHRIIYRNKKEDSKRLITFWTKELPELFVSARKYFLISFILFFISAIVGVISASNDELYIRMILGDSYVNMTLDNIENGDPMAVYGKSGQMEMFLGITLNNIKVSFLAYSFGMFFIIGTAYIVIQNGIMLGSFFYLFYEHGIFWEAAKSVWIHGTLEISAIIIAAAAGIILGKSFIFPGTYTRLRSFTKGAKLSLKIVIGLVPIFILAGFLESFITRYSEMPLFISLLIIFSSLFFIIWYFVILPYRIERQK